MANDLRSDETKFWHGQIAQAVERECERCAKIAEKWKSALRPGTEARRLGHEEAAREIAAAIRANQ